MNFLHPMLHAVCMYLLGGCMSWWHGIQIWYSSVVSQGRFRLM